MYPNGNQFPTNYNMPALDNYFPFHNWNWNFTTGTETETLGLELKLNLHLTVLFIVGTFTLSL
jgi:hypothetical protein